VERSAHLRRISAARDSSRVVNAEDAVTLPLLQARLIELGLPYRLREGE